MKDEDENIKTYTRLTRNTFKKRYHGHKYSFNHRGENSTTLSSHYWKLRSKVVAFWPDLTRGIVEWHLVPTGLGAIFSNEVT